MFSLPDERPVRATAGIVTNSPGKANMVESVSTDRALSLVDLRVERF
jgi:hypothetical protein